MNDLPSYVIITFIITVAATFGFLYFGIKSAQKNKESNNAMVVSVFLMSWLFLQGILALNDFYLNFDSFPPRFVFVILPPLLTIILLFYLKRTRDFIQRIPITTLTYLHIVRVPVEIVLWWLAGSKLLPELLTFEGVNYDILSGISAPFVAIFMLGVRSASRLGAIFWNILTLCLLINVVGHALLSTPLPFQQFAFDQPNIAVFYFPFVWLPGFIVPAVFFAHAASLFKLFGNEEDLV